MRAVEIRPNSGMSVARFDWSVWVDICRGTVEHFVKGVATMAVVLLLTRHLRSPATLRQGSLRSVLYPVENSIKRHFKKIFNVIIV